MALPTNFPPPTRLEHVPVMPVPGTMFRHAGTAFVLEYYDVSAPTIRPKVQGPRMLTLHFVEVPDANSYAEH